MNIMSDFFGKEVRTRRQISAHTLLETYFESCSALHFLQPLACHIHIALGFPVHIHFGIHRLCRFLNLL